MSKLPHLIGVTGYAQHGKDTVATELAWLGYQRVALADVMKQAVLVLDPLIEYFVEEDTQVGAVIKRTRVARLSSIIRERGPEEAKKIAEVRRLYQVMGTEVGRRLLGEDIWIQALAKSIDGLYGTRTPKIVIPDVRFRNEVAWIRRMHGEIWKVVRPNFDNGVGVNHDSEREIPTIYPDETFTNDLGLDYFRGQVRRYLEARMDVTAAVNVSGYVVGEFSEFDLPVPDPIDISEAE